MCISSILNQYRKRIQLLIFYSYETLLHICFRITLRRLHLFYNALDVYFNFDTLGQIITRIKPKNTIVEVNNTPNDIARKRLFYARIFPFWKWR